MFFLLHKIYPYHLNLRTFVFSLSNTMTIQPTFGRRLGSKIKAQRIIAHGSRFVKFANTYTMVLRHPPCHVIEILKFHSYINNCLLACY